MISDKRLMQISLAVSAIGLIALYIITLAEPLHTPIAGLKAGENVVVSGTVNGYRESNGNLFFTVENSSAVKVVMFAAEKTTKIKDGDSITVKGKVQYYRNEIEIIASGIFK